MRTRLAGAALFAVVAGLVLTGCGDKKPPHHPAAANCWAHFDHASRHCDTDGMKQVDGVWINPATNRPINGT